MNRLPPREPSRPTSKYWLSGPQLAAFAAAGTNAHRLFSSSEAWLERFGEDLLLSYKSDAARDDVLAGLAPWSEEHAFRSRRIFGKYLPLQNDERAAPVLLSGEAGLPLTITVSENGMKFSLDFGAGYSAGLFLDQRANRALIRNGDVRRLLNTFAYTCSFSVAAALAGAETVSIDLSKKSLDRGRENFELNSIPSGSESGHRFLADDVLDVLPRLVRKGDLFDAIILDPPTFSRGNKGRKFQVEQDFEALFLAALEVATPRARILLSTNCTRLNRRTLEAIARFGLKAARKAGDLHIEPAVPDIPSDQCAQTLWVNLR